MGASSISGCLTCSNLPAQKITTQSRGIPQADRDSAWPAGWKHCRLILYESFTTRESDNMLCWSGEEVSVSVSDRHTWGFQYQKIINTAVYSPANIAVIEIPMDLFKAAVSYSKTSAETTMGVLRGIHNDKRALDWQPDRSIPDEERSLPFDVDHIELEGPENTVLGNTMFTTIDGRFILTTTSRFLARELIKKAREQLYRGSEFFQDYDMKYVRSREAMLDGLMKKVLAGTETD